MYRQFPLSMTLNSIVLGAIALGALSYSSNTIVSPSAFAQESNCLNNGAEEVIQSQVETIFGELIDLSQFSGVQVVILANRDSMTEAKSTFDNLSTEFGNVSSYRQIMMLNASGMGGMKNMLLGKIKQNAPKDSKSLFMSVDFDGKWINPILESVQRLIPNIAANKQAALLLLDGNGKVMSVYSDLKANNLGIQQCVQAKLSSASQSL
jgi:hypothetical protein